MACYYTGSAEGDARLAYDEARKAATNLSNMLCNTCKRLERAGKLSLLSKETRLWWRKHKKIDREFRK